MRFSPMLLALSTLAMTTCGCATLKLPPLMPGAASWGASAASRGASAASREADAASRGASAASGEANVASGETGVQLQGSESAQAYQRVKQAKSQNAIVLHVPGADEPVRLLPLPSDGQSVFVSDLLRQSGVQKKLGRVSGVLYRASAESINGIRMEVGMTADGRSVRPESDYALQAGDRLEVREAAQMPLNGMLTSIFGL